MSVEIKADPTLSTRFWSKVNKGSGCWMWTAWHNNKGYGQIRVGGTPGILQLAHRISWELTNGPIPGSLCVLHHCDNPLCVNPAHLFLGTPNDNVQDKMAKGRYTLGARIGIKGEKNCHARLTDEQVLEIKEKLKKYYYGMISVLAKEYGVAYPTIYSIKRGDNWKHL